MDGNRAMWMIHARIEHMQVWMDYYKTHLILFRIRAASTGKNDNWVAISYNE